MIPLPSVIAHGISGLIVAASVLYLIIYNASIRKLDSYRLLVLSLLFAIAVGLHGISHAMLEKEYGYVPFYFLFRSK